MATAPSPVERISTAKEPATGKGSPKAKVLALGACALVQSVHHVSRGVCDEFYIYGEILFLAAVVNNLADGGDVLVKRKKFVGGRSVGRSS